MEMGASPAGRDKSLLQFSACREQIWRAFRKLLLRTVGKCLQILEGTQYKYPFVCCSSCQSCRGPWGRHRNRGCFCFCSLLSWRPCIETPLV